MLASALIERALRPIGAVDAGLPLIDDDALPALDALNAWLDAFPDLIGRRLIPTPVSASATMQAGYRYRANTTSSAFNLTFPLLASDGQCLGVVDAQEKFATNNLGLLPNGHLLEGVRSTMLLSANSDNRTWFYREDLGDWTRIRALEIDEEVYFPEGICKDIAVLLADEIHEDYGQPPPKPERVKAARDTIVRRYGKRGRAQSDPPVSIVTPAAPRRTMQA